MKWEKCDGKRINQELDIRMGLDAQRVPACQLSPLHCLRSPRTRALSHARSLGSLTAMVRMANAARVPRRSGGELSLWLVHRPHRGSALSRSDERRVGKECVSTC